MVNFTASSELQVELLPRLSRNLSHCCEKGLSAPGVGFSNFETNYLVVSNTSPTKRLRTWSFWYDKWFCSFKGEVRAICRFWVFDGNGLSGHRLIDSRWFEKNSPTESGWIRRSKKNAHVRTGISRGNARDAICAFKFAPSRHAFDLHTILRLTRALCRSLVVEGSVVCSWFFCQTVALVFPLMLQE